MNRLTVVLLALLPSLWGCSMGTQLTRDGDAVQVHSQMSTLLNGCKKLGPVQVKDNTFNLLDTTMNQTSAINSAREITANMGGDTLVLINRDVTNFGAVATVQGIAMRCYKSN